MGRLRFCCLCCSAGQYFGLALLAAPHGLMLQGRMICAGSNLTAQNSKSHPFVQCELRFVHCAAAAVSGPEIKWDRRSSQPSVLLSNFSKPHCHKLDSRCRAVAMGRTAKAHRNAAMRGPVQTTVACPNAAMAAISG